MRLNVSTLSRKRNKHTINGIFSPLTNYLVAYNPYKTIGIGVAFSPNLDANLHEAKRLAHMLDTQLVVFHVGPESKDKRERINAILYNNGAATITYTLHFVQGKPIDAILNCIKEYKIDLLLLGALTQERGQKSRGRDR